MMQLMLWRKQGYPHAVAEEVRSDVQFQRRAAVGVHRMMVNILQARRAAERAAADEATAPEHELTCLDCAPSSA